MIKAIVLQHDKARLHEKRETSWNGVTHLQKKVGGQNCTVGQKSFGNTLLGCVWVDFPPNREPIDETRRVHMHKKLRRAPVAKRLSLQHVWHAVRTWHPHTATYFRVLEDDSRVQHCDSDDALLDAVRSWLRGAGADSLVAGYSGSSCPGRNGWNVLEF